jgi:photosystem II stability/assembly factor-like uncharacterized protein
MTDKIDIIYDFAAYADVDNASDNLYPQGLCFAARSSGLYRSEDSGRTWHAAYASLNLETPLPTTSVVVSPHFEEDHSVFAGVPGGVLRSVDGGQHWTMSPLVSPPPVVSALVISPNFMHDGVLLAGTMEDGVFRSPDHGRHWSAWNFGLLDLNVLSLAISPDFPDDETLFVGTESGIFYSINGGRAWREVDLPIGYEPVISLAIVPDTRAHQRHGPTLADRPWRGIIFAGTETQGVLRSTDGGTTWEQVGKKHLTDPVNALLLPPDFAERGEVLALMDKGMFLSRDAGETWGKWLNKRLDGQGGSAMLAPNGLGPGAWLLIGLANGEIARIELEA